MGDSTTLQRLKYHTGYASNLSKIISNRYDFDKNDFIEIPNETNLNLTKILIFNGNSLELATAECLKSDDDYQYPINMKIKTLSIKNIISIEEKYDYPKIMGDISESLKSISINFLDEKDNIDINLSDDTPYIRQFQYTHKDHILNDTLKFISKLKKLI